MIPCKLPWEIRIGPILCVALVQKSRIVIPKSLKEIDDRTLLEIPPKSAYSNPSNSLDQLYHWKPSISKDQEPKGSECESQFQSESTQNPGPSCLYYTACANNNTITETKQTIGFTQYTRYKWGLHIVKTVKKASKRLHILRTATQKIALTLGIS